MEAQNKDMVKMKNLKSRKLYLQVYDEIKDYIVSNHLQPGDKLPTEMEMCEILGVSRNVLREAIKSLEITGVVSSKPGVGIIIQEFNTDYLFNSLLYSLVNDNDDMLRQTQEVRLVLEMGFVKEAFNSQTPAIIAKLREQVETMQGIVTIRGSRPTGTLGNKFAEADAAFHKYLYANVNNSILHSIIDAFWACDKYYKVRSPRSWLELTVIKHEKILAALEEKDYQAFYDSMLFHFNVDYKLNESDAGTALGKE